MSAPSEQSQWWFCVGERVRIAHHPDSIKLRHNGTVYHVTDKARSADIVTVCFDDGRCFSFTQLEFPDKRFKSSTFLLKHMGDASPEQLAWAKKKALEPESKKKSQSKKKRKSEAPVDPPQEKKQKTKATAASGCGSCRVCGVAMPGLPAGFQSACHTCFLSPSYVKPQ